MRSVNRCFIFDILVTEINGEIETHIYVNLELTLQVIFLSNCYDWSLIVRTMSPIRYD